MNLLEIHVLKGLHQDLRPFKSDTMAILEKWKAEFKLKNIDKFHKILKGKSHSSLAQHEFLNNHIPNYWKYHFGEENFNAKVESLKMDSLPY